MRSARNGQGVSDSRRHPDRVDDQGGWFTQRGGDRRRHVAGGRINHRSAEPTAQVTAGRTDVGARKVVHAEAPGGNQTGLTDRAAADTTRSANAPEISGASPSTTPWLQGCCWPPAQAAHSLQPIIGLTVTSCPGARPLTPTPLADPADRLVTHHLTRVASAVLA